MEHKYMKNPEIIQFLSQFEKREWDKIIEDLLLFSINKLKEIDKQAEEEIKKQKDIVKNENKIEKPGIIVFNTNKLGAFECATKFLRQNAEYKTNSNLNNKTLQKLNQLDKEINNIHSGNKFKHFNKNYK